MRSGRRNDSGLTWSASPQPLVGFLMQGYNGCVIAYGSPCSGKTYTMLGGSLTGKQRGVLSRVSEDIFNGILLLSFKATELYSLPVPDNMTWHGGLTFWGKHDLAVFVYFVGLLVVDHSKAYNWVKPDCATGSRLWILLSFDWSSIDSICSVLCNSSWTVFSPNPLNGCAQHRKPLPAVSEYPSIIFPMRRSMICW